MELYQCSAFLRFALQTMLFGLKGRATRCSVVSWSQGASGVQVGGILHYFAASELDVAFEEPY